MGGASPITISEAVLYGSIAVPEIEPMDFVQYVQALDAEWLKFQNERKTK